MIAGTSWLVTGATGSFGNAFVPRLLHEGAARVVCFSRDELKQAEMRDRLGDPRLRFFVGNVVDQDRLELAMHGVEYVAHAAAMKRIDTCEENPWEAVQTNVWGTRSVAMACINAGVKRAVFLSTDKAAAPVTLYGTTKLTAERLWTQGNVYAAGRDTRLAATRYGNVLGSRGSVLGIWRSQAELAGQINVTDKRATRYWMTIEQACDLVLTAFREMQGGEVFIPRIPSCDLPTLASTVVDGVPMNETGLRRNEKLHETLISEDEARYVQDRGTHFVIQPERSWEDNGPLWATGFPDGWSYRSDTNEQRIDAAGIAELVA